MREENILNEFLKTLRWNTYGPTGARALITNLPTTSLGESSEN